MKIIRSQDGTLINAELVGVFVVDTNFTGKLSKVVAVFPHPHDDGPLTETLARFDTQRDAVMALNWMYQQLLDPKCTHVDFAMLPLEEVPSLYNTPRHDLSDAVAL